MDMKEQHFYTPEAKLNWWGEGEWVNEPDSIAFEYEGYKCLVSRTVKDPSSEYAFGGHLCGYVHLPENHPLSGFDYDDIPISCHGGLTFSEGGLIGFDCAHSGDYSPSSERFKRETMQNDYMKDRMKRLAIPDHLKWFMESTYKNLAFCIDECKSVVDQLKELKLKHGK